jgi:hypothetical protein
MDPIWYAKGTALVEYINDDENIPDVWSTWAVGVISLV